MHQSFYEAAKYKSAWHFSPHSHFVSFPSMMPFANLQSSPSTLVLEASKTAHARDNLTSKKHHIELFGGTASCEPSFRERQMRQQVTKEWLERQQE